MEYRVHVETVSTLSMHCLTPIMIPLSKIFPFLLNACISERAQPDLTAESTHDPQCVQDSLF